MTGSGRVCVIVNPAAGRGRGARVLDELRAACAAVGITDIQLTTAPGDEQRITREAIKNGAGTLVAVGGDGTWSNVANAILALGAGHDVRLALLAAGTGNDFAKSVGAPAADIAATLRLVRAEGDVLVDVGRVEDYFFLNVSGFGFDIAVLEDVASKRGLRGPAVYVWSALRQLAAFPGLDIQLASPAGSRAPARHLMLIIANARHFGGAFRIAPQASLTDGRLDAVSIHDVSAWRRLPLFAAVTRGTHAARRGVHIEQAPGFTVTFSTPPAYETDGEYRRARQATLHVTCVPKALRIVTSAAAFA